MKYKILKNKKYSVHTPGKILAAPLEWSFFNKDSEPTDQKMLPFWKFTDLYSVYSSITYPYLPKSMDFL